MSDTASPTEKQDPAVIPWLPVSPDYPVIYRFINFGKDGTELSVLIPPGGAISGAALSAISAALAEAGYAVVPRATAEAGGR